MDDFDYEPDLDFGFEMDSAMESIGWGDDDAWPMPFDAPCMQEEADWGE